MPSSGVRVSLSVRNVSLSVNFCKNKSDVKAIMATNKVETRGVDFSHLWNKFDEILKFHSSVNSFCFILS